MSVKEFGHLPNRYWIQTEKGWYSVERGSEAHMREASERQSIRLGLKKRA
jgi:hypothetical protein